MAATVIQAGKLGDFYCTQIFFNQKELFLILFAS